MRLGDLIEHIVKVKGGYRLVSKKSGRNLGTYPTRAGAEKRERQVQYFKHAGESVEHGVVESNDHIGHAIKALYQKIYRAGDDEIEYFYNDSPIFAQYWDEYEGDLDSIIAEVDPAELQVMLDELESYVEQANLAEGDVAKLAGITALGIGAGLGANYLDQQAPKVEFDGKNGQVVKAYLEPAYSNRIPDNAMTIKGKDGKTYHVWSTAGKGMNSKSYHAAPVEQVKEGLVDTVKQGAKKAWDYATEPVDAPNMDTYKKHRAKNIADIRKKKAKQQGVAEGSEERSQNRLWQMITDYEKRAKATSNDIKKAHYLKMADELRSKLKTSDLEEGHRDEENPFEKGSMGDALYKALGSKKASPQQVQRNRERFAKRDAERYTIANDPEKPGLYHYSDISHALQNGHGDSAKVYKHNKFIGTVGDVRQQGVAEESKGLWANIHAKRERIKHGSGEHMRKPGSKGAPTADALRKSAK